MIKDALRLCVASVFVHPQWAEEPLGSKDTAAIKSSVLSTYTHCQLTHDTTDEFQQRKTHWTWVIYVFCSVKNVELRVANWKLIKRADVFRIRDERCKNMKRTLNRSFYHEGPVSGKYCQIGFQFHIIFWCIAFQRWLLKQKGLKRVQTLHKIIFKVIIIIRLSI